MTTYDNGKVKGQDLKDLLEGAIDSNGLSGVLSALSEICYEKGDHLRSNWQDEHAARDWERDAKYLDTLSAKVNN